MNSARAQTIPLQLMVAGQPRDQIYIAIKLLELADKYNDEKKKIFIENMARRYFDVDIEKFREEVKVRMFQKRGLFIIGCVSFIVTTVLGFWAFSIGHLTPSQRVIFTFFAALSGGFGSGSFYGSFKIETASFRGFSLTAVGGFAIFFIIFFFLFSSVKEDSPFAHTIYVQATDASVRSSELEGVLTVRFDKGPEIVEIKDGSGRLLEIDGKYAGEEVGFSIDINDFTLQGEQLLTLESDSQTTIFVRRKSE